MSQSSVELPAGVSVIVPAYNSAGSLPELVQRVGLALAGREEPFEIVLVNDGSEDDTWEEIRKLAGREWVRGLDLSRNYGQHNALLCGIREARYATIVTIDDDLQNPPEEIGRLLDELEDGHDVVYGTPRTGRHGLLRDLASVMTKLALQRAMGARTARQVSAFRAFRTRLRLGFLEFRSPMVSIDVLLTWATTRFSSVTVRHDHRVRGKSNYTFGSLLRHAINMVTGFSTLPLHLASWIGFVFTLFGIAVLAYVILVYLLKGRATPGFAFLASIIAVFSGAQLLALGLIGAYLERIHWRTMARPPFAVRETTDDG